MRSKRIPAEEQYRLIMECRQSGLTDHQWCVEHDIKPGTFYNWVKRLRQKGCVDLPASTGRTYRAPEGQEVVRVEFHDTDPIPYEQPLNVIPAATERNNFSVAESMKLSVGSFHLTIPNGTDPQLLAQTLRIVKELRVYGVRPHKEKINISKEIINKTRGAEAPYVARMNHTPLRGEQQATVL